MQEIPLDKIMTSDVIAVYSNGVVSEVAQAFKENSFHHVPVVDEKKSLVGIISRTDFERIKYGASLFRNTKIDEYNDVLFQSMLVKDIMTKGVLHLQRKDSIYKAYTIFKEKTFRAIPVVDDEKLVGIVTPLDILDYYFEVVSK